IDERYNIDHYTPLTKAERSLDSRPASHTCTQRGNIVHEVRSVDQPCCTSYDDGDGLTVQKWDRRKHHHCKASIERCAEDRIDGPPYSSKWKSTITTHREHQANRC